MNSSINRISFKLLLLMLLLLGSATALIVARSFDTTQREVTRRSAEGLQAQGVAALRTLTEREAELSTATLQQGVATSQQGAQYLVDMAQLDGAVPYDPGRLVRKPSGQWYDPDPARRSEVLLPNTVQQIDGTLQRDLRESAVLDALFPSLMRQYHDAVAMYYISPAELTRYYPLTDLHSIVPPEYAITQDPSYAIAAPPNNPQRKTVWRAPYVDMGGQGLIVTASTPVYVGDRFRGVFAVDVSLTRLVDHLNTLKPTPGSFAFLVNAGGQLIAAPPAFLPKLLAAERGQPIPSLSDTLNLNLAAQADPALQNVVGAMRAGENGVEQVDLSGMPAFVSYAPLANIGWSLGIVAPINELIAQSQTVARAIQSDAAATTQRTLLTMGGIFVLALLGTLFVSHRMLTRPIAALAHGTQAITAGDLGVSIPVRSHDELGRLAASFNHMTTEIRHNRQLLEQQQAERTHELHTLFDISRSVASTLELDTLLSVILQQAKTLIAYDAAAVSLLDAKHTLNFIAYEGPIPQTALPRRWSMAPFRDERTDLATLIAESEHDDNAFGREVVYSGSPLIIPDIQADTPLARTYRRRVEHMLGWVPEYIGTWMGVPLMARDRVIGMLSFDHGEPHHYTSYHAELALALASQAGVAIENARLYEATQAALRKTSALAEIAASVTEWGSLKTVLDRLTEQVVRATGAEASAVTLSDGDARNISYAGSYGLPPGYEAADAALPPSADRAIAPAVVRSQQPVIRQNVRADVLAQPGYAPLHSIVRQVAWDTIISVPLSYRGRPLGTLSTFLRPDYEPTDADVAFLQIIADQAATAVENAALLAEAQDKAALEERQKLARELHDSVSQALYGIALGARTARTLLERDPQRVADPLDYVLQLADAGLAEMRALIFELRPESLATEGIIAALSKQVASLTARHNIAVTTSFDTEPEVPLATKEALYRVAQEALHNTVKHARATVVELRLEQHAETLTLVVRDNGIGFDAAQRFPGHLGLVSMRERIERVGGVIALESRPDHGTTICVSVPLHGSAVAPPGRKGLHLANT